MIDETRILLAKSVLPICSWDWQISEPAFYEAIAPSDGCTDGFASRVREFANSVRSFLLYCIGDRHHDDKLSVMHNGICPSLRRNSRFRPGPARAALGNAPRSLI